MLQHREELLLFLVKALLQLTQQSVNMHGVHRRRDPLPDGQQPHHVLQHHARIAAVIGSSVLQRVETSSVRVTLAFSWARPSDRAARAVSKCAAPATASCASIPCRFVPDR